MQGHGKDFRWPTLLDCLLSPTERADNSQNALMLKGLRLRKALGCTLGASATPAPQGTRSATRQSVRVRGTADAAEPLAFGFGGWLTGLANGRQVGYCCYCCCVGRRFASMGLRGFAGFSHAIKT